MMMLTNSKDGDDGGLHVCLQPTQLVDACDGSSLTTLGTPRSNRLPPQWNPHLSTNCADDTKCITSGAAAASVFPMSLYGFSRSSQNKTSDSGPTLEGRSRGKRQKIEVEGRAAQLTVVEVVWEHGGLRKGKWGNRERGERRERGGVGSTLLHYISFEIWVVKYSTGW